MVFSKTESKPAEDTTFDISANESLKPSVLSTMDYYQGADLRTLGIEYPEGYVPPVQPALEPAVVEESPEEAAEETSGPRVSDNGLGIMVIDTPAERHGTEPVTHRALETERHSRFYEISFNHLSLDGVKRAISSARELPSAISRAVSADMASRLSSIGEKVTLAEHKTARKRIAIAALGGLALGAAYAASKGIHLSSSSHHHEALQSAAPAKVPNRVSEVIQHNPKAVSPAHQVAQLSSASANKVHAAKEKIDEITVKPGEGITQTIRDYYPGKSASQYADAYNKLSAKVGASHIIEGIQKYKMSDGSIGLSHAGKARWGAHVHSFLQGYFKQPK